VFGSLCITPKQQAKLATRLVSEPNISLYFCGESWQVHIVIQSDLWSTAYYPCFVTDNMNMGVKSKMKLDGHWTLRSLLFELHEINQVRNLSFIKIRRESNKTADTLAKKKQGVLESQTLVFSLATH
jgi:hypothetical protein